MDSSALVSSSEPGVLVIDRCRLTGEALASVLKTRPWVGSIRTAPRLDPMDRMTGLIIVNARDADAAALPELVHRYNPDASLIVLGVGGDAAEIVRWAERGVAGILTEDDGLDELDAVAATVASGRPACSRPVAGVLLRQFSVCAPAAPGVRADAVHLTPREREVLALIELSWTNKQIAHHLCIEVRTVKNHVHNLLEKLRVSRRSEAATWRNRGARISREPTRTSPPWPWPSPSCPRSRPSAQSGPVPVLVLTQALEILPIDRRLAVPSEKVAERESRSACMQPASSSSISDRI
jgi:DNA-binding NarL/FixJ family response regulator